MAGLMVAGQSKQLQIGPNRGHFAFARQCACYPCADVCYRFNGLAQRVRAQYRCGCLTQRAGRGADGERA